MNTNTKNSSPDVCRARFAPRGGRSPVRRPSITWTSTAPAPHRRSLTGQPPRQSVQDAVHVADPGDEIAATNGTYATGGRAVGTEILADRVAVDKALTVRSVNGPQFTAIQGYHLPNTTTGDGAIRCVYLTSGATMSGFTLTNGATRQAKFRAEWRRAVLRIRIC